MFQIPVSISFSETIPGSDPKSLFSGGAQAGPPIVGSVAAVLTVDPAYTNGLFSGTAPAAPVHLTTADLRAQYSDSELLAALQAPKS